MQIHSPSGLRPLPPPFPCSACGCARMGEERLAGARGTARMTAPREARLNHSGVGRHDRAPSYGRAPSVCAPDQQVFADLDAVVAAITDTARWLAARSR